jgi:hypothetical protein
MKAHVWHIGLFGTFDVENYGDLLFPLIARAELTKRLGSVEVHPFSYNAKALPAWPYTVTSLAELPQMAEQLDGVLIGGGHIVRFDKQIADNYGPPIPAIHHPTGYWLTPALIALQQRIPLMWNAPGVLGKVPEWAKPLMELTLNLSSYIAVRDETSRSALEPLSGGQCVSVVPDTAFGISQLVKESPTAEFSRLRESAGFSRPYIVIQAIDEIKPYLSFLKNNPQVFKDFQLLVLPIGPVLGDSNAVLDGDLPEAVCLSSWPQPLLLAEIISQASAVIGASYHLAITALAFGVPVFSNGDPYFGKQSALSKFETIYFLPKDRETDPGWVKARLGKTPPSANAARALDQLFKHWDRIAAAIRQGRTKTEPALNRFWQSLPGLLERSGDLEKLLAAARADISFRDEEVSRLRKRVSQIHSSPSWKVTAPARYVMRSLKRLAANNGHPIIDLTRIRRHNMQSDPYSWARIDNLFSPKQASALLASFPCDHFKLVDGYDGEKDYEYAVRSLIPMAARTISNADDLSEPWLALGREFLSRRYRDAMSSLTGFDLNTALLEVNVFHYGSRSRLGPHVDLPDKLVTHVLYFNESWDKEDGGCLRILRSSDPDDTFAELPPIIGSSVVLVRSLNSWHAVSSVVPGCRLSRRSVTATFYRPGSVSTMWPPGDYTPLHNYEIIAAPNYKKRLAE